MRIPPLFVFLCFSTVGLTQGQDNAEPQRVGNLLVALSAVSTPASQGRFEIPSDRYWVVTEVNFRNVGKLVVCADFVSTLKAEYGLVARGTVPNSLAEVAAATISELLPGEEAQQRFIFNLKRGADPLELTVETANYGARCGDRLPQSIVRSARFPIRGVSSPKKADYAVLPAAVPVRCAAGGAYRIGGGVSQPTVIFKVEPEYSEEARKAKFQGTVVMFIVVDEHGNPCDVSVIRPLGLGLDQKAIEAVEKWRFNPGKKDGKPVPVQTTIEVNFRLL